MSTKQETRYAVQRQASAEYPFVIWDDKYHRFVTAHATCEEAEESTNRLNSRHEHKEEETRAAGNGNGTANKPDSLSALRAPIRPLKGRGGVRAEGRYAPQSQ